MVDPSFLVDPYPAYRALREAGSLHWSEEFFGGAWLVTRHRDVELVLRDARFSAKRTGGWINNLEQSPGELSRFQRLFGQALLFRDAPDHSRLRNLIQPAFRPDALARLRPTVEHLTGELLDALKGQDCFDFIAQVARLLPVRVISHVLGISGAESQEVMSWSDDLADFIGAPVPTREQLHRAQASLSAMLRFLRDQLMTKRVVAESGLLSELLRQKGSAGFHDEAELLAQSAMLLFAGHETTRNLLGNGLCALLRHPDQWQLLLDDVELVPGAVRELLRYDSPVQYTGRRVATDLLFDGQPMRRGELVLPLIGSANRDPARHVDPEMLNVRRFDPGTLSFGSGPHACLGAVLTRMEADVLFRQMLARWPRLRLDRSELRWCANPAYRGLQALYVRSGHAEHAPGA